MPGDAFYVALAVLVTLELAANAYVVLAAWCVAGMRRRQEPPAEANLPVSVLMPVCGVDIGLYDNLRALCSQDFPDRDYQVVLGVQDPDDPAIQVIRRIIREFPERDIELVIADGATGPNLKIGNLCNMYARAKHPALVIVDSDMRVKPNYLKSVTAPLGDPTVGVVTCLYKGTPVKGLPSLLGSMFVNEWFLPSALVAVKLSPPTFCFGATMAVRREVLDELGGFDRLRPYLADDYMLGQMVHAQGYKVHLSTYIVDNVVIEHTLKSLFLHELRWARTIRTVRPWSYAMSFLMYSIPLGIIAALIGELTLDADAVEIGFLAVVLALRVALHYIARTMLDVSYGPRPLLVPLRDILSFAVWVCGFFGNAVVWRGESFRVGRAGKLEAVKEAVK